MDDHQEHVSSLADELDATQRLGGVGTWYLDLRTQTNTWSQELYRIAGQPDTFEPTTEHRWLMCHPDDRQLLTTAAEAINDGRPFRLQYRIVRPDGQVRCIVNNAAPVQDAAGQVVAYRGAVRDITAEAEYHESLERERRRLMEAQAVARVGSWDWDVSTGRIDWSDETFRIFGTSRDTFEVTFRNFLEMIPAADRQMVTGGVEAALAGTATYRVRHRVLRPDGSVAVVQERGEVVRDPLGTPVRMIGTVQDVTEQARAETGLLDRERRLRRAQEIGQIGDWVWSTETGFVAWSEQMFRLYGVDPSLGQPSAAEVAALFHPDDRDWVVAAQRRAVVGDASSYEMQHRIVRPSGEIRWVQTRALLTRDQSGRVIEIQGTNLDITDRMHAEDDLRRLSDSLNHGERLALLGSYEWERGGDRLWWSDQLYDLYGYERGSVTPTLALALSHMPPDEQEPHRDLVHRQVESGTGWDVEYRIRSASGVERIVRDRAEIARNADGQSERVHGTIQDITARALTEARLRRLSESLARGEQMAHVGTYEWEAATDTLWWSDELYRIFGLEPNSLTPSHRFVLSRAHPDDHLILRERVAEGVRDGTGWDLEYRLYDASGALRVVHEVAMVIAGPDGRPERVYGSAQDITEEVRLRERVQAQAQEVLSIINASLLPIVVIDSRGLILQANPATERAFGWDDEELRGRNVAMLAADVTLSQHDRYLAHYLATGESSTPEGAVIGRTREIRARRRDGSEFSAQLTVAEASATSGERRFIGIMMDLTEQQATEQHLRQLQKTEALGTLVAGVAHDFNNLLTAIRGGVEMAQRAPGDGRWLEIADQATGRATDLVRQLLRFGRREDTVRDVVSPGLLLSETAVLVREVLDRRIWFEVIAEDDLPAIEADSGQIQQVLMNLIVNARDAVLERALLSAEPYEPSIYLSGRKMAQDEIPGVVLEAVDNGTGMSEEVRARALDPFFTTKPVDRGTGLGLSMAVGIVQHHGGRLLLTSEVGLGTTCSIWLPAHTGTRGSSSNPEGPPEPTGQPGRVLIVDDEPALAEVTAAFLAGAGYETVIANGGAEGIRLARGQAFDLAVLDLNMPSPNGWEVLDALRAMQPDYPVLMVSGYLNPDEADRREVWFLPKPYGRGELVAAVQRALRRPPGPPGSS